MPTEQRSTLRAFNYLKDRTGREQRKAYKHIRPYTIFSHFFIKIAVAKN